MLVGFMRNYRKPLKLARLVAKMSKCNNVDLVYFTAADIDINRKKINGKILVNDKWITKEVGIPAFIDISALCFKYKEEVQFLRENSILSTERLPSKYKVDKKIKRDGEFSHLIIPSGTFTNFNDFHEFLEHHVQIVLKPKNGQKGEGIYMLSKNESDYTLSYKNDETQISKEVLENFFEEEINKEKYIFQKFINSRSKTGDPFDCRIRLEKNGNGKWGVAINLVRIGTGQKVVSNVSQGGSVNKLNSFLRNNFEDKQDVIKTRIVDLAKTFPYKLERLFNRRFTSLGLDIGIDRDGNLYLFEINTAPGDEFALGEIALLKSEYYDYMLNKAYKRAN
ncbi:YheC/YheD family protein [Virgibacillus sp. C22-A2]|uniref:YheC/YheD family protein n=1 Tax=Virgibacillus tibetensis TaxID=3042313 RepID=A0ABU6KF51_9BACI|nr:YheC/YheD family protein [Virgibacillus sp. C22-A2]